MAEIKMQNGKWFGLMALTLLAACAAPAPRPALPSPPVHPKGQVLWHILHDKCVPNQRANGDPAPCARVDLSRGEGQGYVLLKDLRGVAQYLLMPTAKITGMEDPALLKPGAVDYFRPAWAARTLVEAKLGKTLPPQDLSIAVNSLYGRSQDQLHLHIDCIRTDVRDALRHAAGKIGTRWTRRPIDLAGDRYYAIRLNGKDMPDGNPFRLLHRGLHVPQKDMGAWTLVLTGADAGAGSPGFILLAARADPPSHRDGSGEALQDHDCKIAD